MSLYPPLVRQSGPGVAVLNDADACPNLSCPALGGKGKVWPTLDLDALGRCCSDSCRWTIDVGGESALLCTIQLYGVRVQLYSTAVHLYGEIARFWNPDWLKRLQLY